MKYVTRRTGTAYDYPKRPSEVELGKYIQYHKELLPKMPTEVVEFAVLRNQYAAIMDELEPWHKKAKTTTPEELRAFLTSGKAKDNAKKFLPGLLASEAALYDKLMTAGEKMDDVWAARKWIPFQMEVVRLFTGITEELEVDEINYLYKHIVQATETPKQIEYKQLYTHNGKVYTLPGELMKRATLGEFAEAAQYEKSYKALSNGDAAGLLHMIAVLLRPLDTPYSEEQFEQNVNDFQTLSLQTAFEVAFFLTRLSLKYVLDFQTSTALAGLRQLAPDLVNWQTVTAGTWH